MGLNLDANSGILSGAATENGTFNFTIRATDPQNNGTDRSFNIDIGFAEDCNALLQADSSIIDGTYNIKPSAAATDFTTYCDMTGGGWTLAGVQVPGQEYSLRTTADISSANFGSLTNSWRYGNAIIQTFSPSTAWRITSEDPSAGGVLTDNAFFMPSCVIDWNLNIGALEGGPEVPECATAYTNDTFSTLISSRVIPNSALGIGQNNSANFCSIRMANNDDAGLGFMATPCIFIVRTLILKLWMK